MTKRTSKVGSSLPRIGKTPLVINQQLFFPLAMRLKLSEKTRKIRNKVLCNWSKMQTHIKRDFEMNGRVTPLSSSGALIPAAPVEPGYTYPRNISWAYLHCKNWFA